MRSYRRMAAVAVLGAIAAAALSSCGTQSNTAASVGSDQITEHEVDTIFNDAKLSQANQASSQPGAGQTGPVAVTRQFIVQMFVLDRVCAQMQAEQKFPAAALDQAQVAAAFGVAPGTKIVDLTQKAYSCIRGIPATAGAPLTQAQKEELFAAAQAAGVFAPTDTMEKVAAQLDSEQVRQAYAERELFAKATSKAHVSVNPRYRELKFPLLQAQDGTAVVYVPLGQTANTGVTNAPSPSGTPTAATPPQN